MSHTPGPWKVSRKVYGSTEGGKCAYREIESGTSICWIARAQAFSDGPIDKAPPEWEANARLIAAAPELLEACRACLGHIAGEPGELLSAAIAKAEGRQ